MKNFIKAVIKELMDNENLKVENNTATLTCKKYWIMSSRMNTLEWFLFKNNIKYKKRMPISTDKCLCFSYSFTFENKEINFLIQWENDGK